MRTAAQASLHTPLSLSHLITHNITKDHEKSEAQRNDMRHGFVIMSIVRRMVYQRPVSDPQPQYTHPQAQFFASTDWGPLVPSNRITGLECAKNPLLLLFVSPLCNPASVANPESIEVAYLKPSASP